MGYQGGGLAGRPKSKHAPEDRGPLGTGAKSVAPRKGLWLVGIKDASKANQIIGGTVEFNYKGHVHKGIFEKYYTGGPKRFVTDSVGAIDDDDLIGLIATNVPGIEFDLAKQALGGTVGPKRQVDFAKPPGLIGLCGLRLHNPRISLGACEHIQGDLGPTSAPHVPPAAWFIRNVKRLSDFPDKFLLSYSGKNRYINLEGTNRLFCADQITLATIHIDTFDRRSIKPTSPVCKGQRFTIPAPEETATLKSILNSVQAPTETTFLKLFQTALELCQRDRAIQSNTT
ncbi:uncharacterized protein BP01DRAFT_366638 [Aspergillus saccharolyticus JOP 1030-1]|uniref:Uncharacterized protein n=1 Tax=Aspergillus saccharolyticus JOP 1030-1 TaxID=1450539 RepID=A0A318ZCE3_9EURO|nr:hypothetical protein BP01DRAFT_366638 [Aspergillus saccharolyticus JOP 1030-1]PYH44197.1 hypothetical protein BP01DRAFT_366638 [Aspergillus saccharolyticus JOP 1030-1]